MLANSILRWALLFVAAVTAGVVHAANCGLRPLGHGRDDTDQVSTRTPHMVLIVLDRERR